MSEITPRKLENNIIKWLEKEKSGTIIKLDEKKYHFVLKVKDSRKPEEYPAIQIRNSRENPHILSIGWSWGLTKEDIKTYKDVDKKIKRKIGNEILDGFLLMNITGTLTPSVENLKIIACFKNIYLDGLSNDRFIDIVDRVFRAYLFTARKFDEYLGLPDIVNPKNLT